MVESLDGPCLDLSVHVSEKSDKKSDVSSAFGWFGLLTISRITVDIWLLGMKV